MKTNKKVICNKCNKEIETKNLIQIYIKTDRSIRKKWNLCETCYSFVESFIKR